MRLIPREGRNTANYWCSWRSQRLFMPNPFLHMRLYDAPAHEIVQREMLSDEFLFGNPGVISKYMHDIRKDMYILLDDGWDIPYNGNYTAFGSLVPNEERFPYGKQTPAENLAALSEKIAALGYSGTGLWIPMKCVDETCDNVYNEDKFRKYWIKRAHWLNKAKIAYIKADWGIHCDSIEYRRILTDVMHEYAPEVKVEHATVEGWFFNPDKDRYELAELMQISDCFRCYDAVFDFNTVTTLGRVAAMLTLDCDVREDCEGLINAGEEPYIAAALGCTMGIMSHPMLRGSIISMIPDDFTNGISHRMTLKSEYHSFDHYTRALRWQRLAPAFPFRKGEILVSENTLEDSWTFEKEPYPYHHNPSWTGRTMYQSAPQIVARNAVLPEIVNSEIPHYERRYQPYVAASVNPITKVYTIAALPRTIDGVMNCTTPKADIIGRGVSAEHCFAVFGNFGSLTLEFDRNIEGKRLFGGDILLDEQPEITHCDGVKIEGNRLILDGSLLNRVGCEAAAFHDLAEPGSVFRLV